MELKDLLVCPKCKSELKEYSCPKCKKKYFRGKPVFIKPKKHSREDIVDFFVQNAKWAIPSPSLNFRIKENLRLLEKKLPSHPNILVIGGGSKEYSKGTRPLLKYKPINLEITEGPAVDVIADAHNLPFKDNSFDLVVIQAVLEHVKYPGQVVKEIHRVLKKKGYVYAEIPFMQGVHGRPYDFQRYTNEGIDVLFEDFNKLKSGPLIGPTASFIWVLREYLSGVFSLNNKYLYYFLNFILGWMFSPLKYLDYILIHFKFSSNIAGAFYFIGKK